MALMNCPECGKEISDTVKKCPNCGFKIVKNVDKKKKVRLFVIGGVSAVILLLVLYVLYAGSWSFKNVQRIFKSGSFKCLISHEWEQATCEHGLLCSLCGSEKGEPIDHDWLTATCFKPETCSMCGEQRGEKLEHKWSEATCSSPRTCSVCHATQGNPLGHSTRIGYCSKCGEHIDELMWLHDELADYHNEILEMLAESLGYMEGVANGTVQSNRISYIKKTNNKNQEIKEVYQQAIDDCGEYKEFSNIKLNLKYAKAKLYVFDEILDFEYGAYTYCNALSNSIADSLDSLNVVREELDNMLE